MFCTNCGKELPDNTEICTNCGAIPKIPAKSTTENLPSEFNGQDIPHDNKNYSDVSLAEKDELTVNKFNKPLSTSAFFFTQILFMIPLLNLLFILIWSFKKNTNLNLKSYARSKLIWYIIISLFFIFILLTMSFLQYPISPSTWIYELKKLL